MTQTVYCTETPSAPPVEITVAASVQTMSASYPIDIEVVAISRSGARVVAKSPLRSGEDLTFRLVTLDGSVELQQICRSTWVRLSPGYCWNAGVVFDEPIDLTHLEKLETLGCFEQRASPGFDAHIQGKSSGEQTIVDMDVVFTNVSTEQAGSGKDISGDTDSEGAQVRFANQRHSNSRRRGRNAKALLSRIPVRSCICVLGVAMTVAGAAWVGRDHLSPGADHSTTNRDARTATMPPVDGVERL